MGQECFSKFIIKVCECFEVFGYNLYRIDFVSEYRNVHYGVKSNEADKQYKISLVALFRQALQKINLKRHDKELAKYLSEEQNANIDIMISYIQKILEWIQIDVKTPSRLKPVNTALADPFITFCDDELHRVIEVKCLSVKEISDGIERRKQV